MKRAVFCIIALGLLAAAAFAEEISRDKWVLAWQDEFEGIELDSKVWSKCERRAPDWANTMSDDPALFELRDGVLVLRGIVNPDTVADPSPYLTGGIYTYNKKSFAPGRFEVRARLQGARGAWPAIWLLPFRPRRYPWPAGGEIDIMERLNYDEGVYQTVHSTYTVKEKNTTNPKASVFAPVKPDEWNVYGVDMLPDKIVFHINGVITNEYPRVEGVDAAVQFPFTIAQYLLIDMQLGGKWVGEVDPADLPVQMEVDWVRYSLPE